MKTYRFKYQNVDLQSYCKELQEQARAERREAETLIFKAECREDLASHLEIDLVEVTVGGES